MACLHIIRIKLALFKLGCYKFKMLIVIPKVVSQKITSNHDWHENLITGLKQEPLNPGMAKDHPP